MTAAPAVRLAAVALPVPVRRTFTYSVPDALRAGLGSRVRVRFGNRRLVGTVVGFEERAPDDVELRPLEAVLDDVPSLSPGILELTRFVADYYLCSWGEAIETALPRDPGPAPRRRAVRRLPAADPAALGPRARARRALLARLPADGALVDLARLPISERRAVAALAAQGFVEVCDRPVDAGTEGRPVDVAEPAPEPTPGQVSVLAELEPALDERVYRPFLLFGATGSGKTEVYLRAARRALEAGRGVVYLVPEIGLTPLLVSKIRGRFPDALALLHSGMSPRQRHEAWERVRDGSCRLVVGTRSAVFAPVADLGLIVVDEEQDGSYKQDETPRYNGRDIAVVRARSAGAVLLLGSATPSMESFHHARAGRYRLLRLGGRVRERPLPRVEFVDMRLEYQRTGQVSPVSAELLEGLRECVGRGDQALVLRNRRGWAAAVFCPRCGSRVTCDNCSIALTWHLAEQRLRCHHCNLAHAMPETCPTCGAEELKQVGEGSERIESIVRDALGEAVVERMDRDTIRRRGSHERLLRRFERGEIQVLVGTQMIAKGHDFPRVTLVGVLNADQALGLPDFRAGERVFQLLTQVAGRAGRGERPGTVLIQAFDPDHPVLRQAAGQDYEAFYDREMRYRSALRYPPVSAMVQIVIRHREAYRARGWAELAAQALERERQGRLIVSGPGPAPIERLRGEYRQQILVRTAGRRRLVEATERALASIAGEIPARSLQVDVDPYSLL